MQYIKLKKKAEDVDLFSDDEVEEGIQPMSHEDYERLIEYLKVKNPPAILPCAIMSMTITVTLKAILLNMKQSTHRRITL